jgi:hypothetical protein
MAEQITITRNGTFKQTMLGGYDRLEVEDYIERLHRRIEELEQAHSPQGAVRRALEQVGDEVSGILQRAHETAATVTESSRREADERLEAAKRTAAALVTDAEAKVRQLDVDTDRIWAERDRIVLDMRELAGELSRVADAAAERFPPEDGAESFDSGDIETLQPGDLRHALHPGEDTQPFTLPEEAFELAEEPFELAEDLDEPADAGD